MAEDFSNQLAQWVEQRGLQTSDKNFVAFMAVRDDVKLAIDAGYAVKTVWANLRETDRITVRTRPGAVQEYKASFDAKAGDNI